MGREKEGAAVWAPSRLTVGSSSECLPDAIARPQRLPLFGHGSPASGQGTNVAARRHALSPARSIMAPVRHALRAATLCGSLLFAASCDRGESPVAPSPLS